MHSCAQGITSCAAGVRDRGWARSAAGERDEEGPSGRLGGDRDRGESGSGREPSGLGPLEGPMRPVPSLPSGSGLGVGLGGFGGGGLPGLPLPSLPMGLPGLPLAPGLPQVRLPVARLAGT